MRGVGCQVCKRSRGVTLPILNWRQCLRDEKPAMVVQLTVSSGGSSKVVPLPLKDQI
jgi:hypothetical protein